MGIREDVAGEVVEPSDCLTFRLPGVTGTVRRCWGSGKDT